MPPVVLAGVDAAELAGLAGLDRGYFRPLPVDLQMVGSAGSFQVPGDEILDLLEVLFVGAFGAYCQRVRAGLHGAPAPFQDEGPVGAGAFDVLYFRAGLRIAGVQAEDLVVDAAGVPAKLDEVPARVLGLDAGFGGQHASSSFLVRAASQARIPSGPGGLSSVAGSIESTRHPSVHDVVISFCVTRRGPEESSTRPG
jgi:hypothetical protein